MKFFLTITAGILIVNLTHFTIASEEEEGSGGENECNGECPTQYPIFVVTETLEIAFYWDQYVGGDAVNQLYAHVCQLIENFGGIVSIYLKPGAGITVEDGYMICPDDCVGDREQGCFIMLDPLYQVTCKLAEASEEDLETCVYECASDEMIIQNGLDRVDAGIPDCGIPAITFNGFYDFCATFETYEELEAYVCGLYEFSIDPCASLTT